ncbi:MAG TPA: EamA family transporter [Methylomirabilota bacterium]
MALADVVLLLANALYATSYVPIRVVLADVPPATLAFLRLALGWLVLLPLGRPRVPAPASTADQALLIAMGVAGFAAPYALINLGMAESTATHAALLVIVEPMTLILLSPLFLGERLRGLEVAGAVLALVGGACVVVNGIPGVSAAILPHGRGDALIVLAGVAFASYSLLGRPLLHRHDALTVTSRSIVWGAVAMAPFALHEWITGARAAWTATAVVGTLYLAVAITAVGYLVWNWALARVQAPRAAIFLNVQPLGGALLGVFVLGETATVFTVVGAVLIVAGLCMTIQRKA